MKYNVTKNGIEIKTGKKVFSLEVFSDDIIRVKHGPAGMKKRQSLSVCMERQPAGWYVEEGNGSLTLITQKLKVKSQKQAVAIMLSEKRKGESGAKPEYAGVKKGLSK